MRIKSLKVDGYGVWSKLKLDRLGDAELGGAIMLEAHLERPRRQHASILDGHVYRHRRSGQDGYGFREANSGDPQVGLDVPRGLDRCPGLVVVFALLPDPVLGICESHERVRPRGCRPND